MPKTYRQLNPNERDIVAVLKSKGESLGKSPGFSSEVPAPFHGSLNEMPLRFIPDITWLTKPRSEPINASTNPMGGRGSKATLLGVMSKNAFASDGLRNLSPGGSLSIALGKPLAMKPSINGFTRRLPISFCPWCEPIASANTEATPEDIKHRIFQRGPRSKSVRKPFSSAFTSAIGKLTPSAAVKATRLSKLPWNVKPDTQRWLNLKPKAHEP